MHIISNFDNLRFANLTCYFSSFFFLLLLLHLMIREPDSREIIVEMSLARGNAGEEGKSLEKLPPEKVEEPEPELDWSFSFNETGSGSVLVLKFLRPYIHLAHM